MAGDPSLCSEPAEGVTAQDFLRGHHHGFKIPIDSHMRMAYYWRTMIRPNIFLILLLLATYLVAPVLDAVACDHCNCTPSLPAAQMALSSGSCQSGPTDPTADHEKNIPSDPGMDKELCPLCANAAFGMQSQIFLAPVLTVHIVGMPALLALLDPSYPINKPPQN